MFPYVQDNWPSRRAGHGSLLLIGTEKHLVQEIPLYIFCSQCKKNARGFVLEKECLTFKS